MKHLKLIFALMLCPFLIFAQNGGQFLENAALKLQYAGNTNGTYYVKITNKQDCNASVRVVVGTADQSITIAKGGFYLYPVPPTVPYLKLKAKPLTDCGCGDMGWVEISLIAMPVTFTKISFRWDKDDKDKGYIHLETEQMVNVRQFNIRFSLDEKTFYTMAIIWPDPSKKIYEYPISYKQISKQLQTINYERN